MQYTAFYPNERTLRIAGCGCCEEPVEATQENMEEFIEDLEDNLKQAKEYLQSHYGNKTNNNNDGTTPTGSSPTT